MSEELKLKLLKQIEELQKEIDSIKSKNLNKSKKPVYKYSKIRDIDLEKLVDIEKR